MEAKEIKKENSLRRQPGHAIFEFNVETGVIKAAEVVNGIVIKGQGCLYCSALNLVNADKHFTRSIKKVMS